MSASVPTPEAIRQKQQLSAALRHHVARESDRCAESAREVAASLARINKIEQSSVRGVETLAYSTDKVSDLTDLLNKQIGRDGRGERWAREGVGAFLLSALENLRRPADHIADQLHTAYPDATDDDLARRIHLTLCREYVRHLAANFEYFRKEKEAEL